MNHVTHNQQTRGPDDDRLLDRLVDGELPDAERRDLLLKFENKPDGWRRCALAFLEAQTWRQGLASMAGTNEALAVAPDHPRRKRTFRSPVARLTGLAAGLAVAFALGWTYHGGLDQTVPSTGLNQQAESVAEQAIQPPQDATVQVATKQSRPTKPTEPLASLNPLVKHWQQRGYSVETEQRLVSMESKDGRKVKLPVQEVRIRYIGDRIY